jgi:hypothetical protein
MECILDYIQPLYSTSQTTYIFFKAQLNSIFSTAYLFDVFLALVTVHHELRVKRRERDQQDATNLMFIIKLSQHVPGIIMPIIRRIRVCTAAYGVLHC